MHSKYSSRQLCLGLFMLLALACDQPVEADPQAACPRDEYRSCTTSDGCEGLERCGGNPARWQECECLDPEPSPEKPKLGGPCQNDGDCVKDAFCLDPDDDRLYGGGPPQGTCAATCSSSDDCDPFEDAVCVDVTADPSSEPTKLCLPRCRIGAPDDPGEKCDGRAEVACSPAEGESSVAFCRPLCTSHEDCPNRFCDPRYGVCRDQEIRDTTFGLLCGATDDSDGGTAPEPTTCAGPCVQINDAPQICSRACTFGNPDECAPASGDQRRGACIYALEGGGIGDLGYCGELCDCSDDCLEPTFLCDAFADANLEGAFGRQGVCTDPSLLVNNEISCD